METTATYHSSDFLCPLHNIAALWRLLGSDLTEMGPNDPITEVRRDALLAAVEATSRAIAECAEKVEAWERDAA